MSDPNIGPSGHAKRPGSPHSHCHRSSQDNMPPTPRVEVSELSDEKLRRQLKAHGVDIGPILPTTRGLYEKKLLQFLTGQAPETSHYEPVDDDEEEDEEVPSAMTEEPVVRVTPARRRPLHNTSSYTSPASTSSPSFTKSQSTEPEEERSLPLAVKVCIFILVLFIGYLVYVNLEPNAHNRIPGKVEMDV